MGQFLGRKFRVLLLAMVAALLVGCGAQPAMERADDAGAYAGALDLSYEGALDSPTQLALGTLKLEETADAVTEEQAVVLLPLWQALAGGALKGAAERTAVLRQIESSMREGQVAAIADMRLTGEDLRAWAQSQTGRAGAPGGQGQGGRQRPGGGQGGGQGPGGAASGLSDDEQATRRAEFQNVSDDERATRRAQFSQGGAGDAGPAQPSGTAGGPLAAVIALLSERAGVAVSPAVARQRPSRTPPPTGTPIPPRTETPTSVPAVTPTIEPTFTPTTAPTATGAPEPSATPTAGSAVSLPTRAPAQAVYDSPALEQLPDSDPGPPLAVEVSANRAYADPLVEESRLYLVSGIVRNDGSEHYALSALHVTFFDAEGFRGSYRRFPGRGRTGGEWIWHGKTEADVPCLLLAPGEQCPFVVEIRAQDMASFVLHPDAGATERQSAPLEASGLRLARDGTEYVTVSGQVTNTYPYAIKNVVLSGVLLDAAGEILSLGSAYVIEEDIEPGQVMDFEIRIHDPAFSIETPFSGYRVYAQAERDWD
jgi:hypothetical protein